MSVACIDLCLDRLKGLRHLYSIMLLVAGKSTLLNALTASSCLPSNNVPETARITKLIHTGLQAGEQPWLRDQAKGVTVHGQVCVSCDPCAHVLVAKFAAWVVSVVLCAVRAFAE